MARKKAHLKKKLKQKSSPKSKTTKKQKNKPVYSNKLVQFYHDKYKVLLIIPIVLLLLSLANITYMNIQTDDYFIKGISLSGGVTVTALEQNIDIVTLENNLRSSFSEYEVNVREIRSGGVSSGAIIESNILPDNQNVSDAFIQEITTQTGIPRDALGVESIGASLGESFFRQAALALVVAFIFMAFVVYLYFKTLIPSLAVVLAAFSNIALTVGILNITGTSIGTSGIAALLMLIGYSVDTDILLTTRMLKERDGTSFDRLMGAFKTGITMSATTFVAVLVTYLLAQSDVLREILLIVLIGLLVDQINTWLQNASIIRYYLERKGVDYE